MQNSQKKTSKSGSNPVRPGSLRDTELNQISVTRTIGNSLIIMVAGGGHTHAYALFSGLYGLGKGAHIAAVTDICSLCDSSEACKSWVEKSVDKVALSQYLKTNQSVFITNSDGEVCYEDGNTLRETTRTIAANTAKARAAELNKEHAAALAQWQKTKGDKEKSTKKPGAVKPPLLEDYLTAGQKHAEESLRQFKKTIDRTPYLEEAERLGIVIQNESGTRPTHVPGVDLAQDRELTLMKLRKSVTDGTIFHSITPDGVTPSGRVYCATRYAVLNTLGGVLKGLSGLNENLRVKTWGRILDETGFSQEEYDEHIVGLTEDELAKAGAPKKADF